MNQPYLLDTCAALWIVAGELPQPIIDLLSDARRGGLLTYVSPITAWEVGTLARKGRFRSSYTPQRWFERLVSLPGVALAELSATTLMESSFLPGVFHADPADRINAPTAREFGFTVMTRDRPLLDYAAQGYLSAVAC